jgi:hypothetical protein
MSLPSHAALDAARCVGDAAADAVVEALGRDAWLANAALRHAHDNGEPLPEALPSVVRRFLSEQVTIPPWFDDDPRVSVAVCAPSDFSRYYAAVERRRPRG